MPADRAIKAGPVPQDVLRYWRAKKLVPSFSHLDVFREEHDMAFTAAKVMRRDVLKVLSNALDDAIAEGQDFRAFVKNVQPRLVDAGWWDEHEVEDPETGDEVTVDPPKRLKLIFDTNVRVARAIGQWDRIQKGAKLRPYLLYGIGPSKKHRDQHVAWHGVLLPVDDPFWTYAFPPNGFNCFLPGTMVSGAFIGASKAWYAGHTVQVQCQSGATLTVTANHPIATAQGWLPACELQAGMHTLSDAREVELVRAARLPHPAGRAIRDQDVPARIEDVFEALATHRGCTTQVSPLDFHGDAQHFVGEIDVVGSYVELVRQRDAMRAQRRGQASFTRTDHRLPLIHGGGELLALAQAAHASGRSGERGPADLAQLVGGHAAEAFVRRCGATAQLHAVALKKPPEGDARHAAFLRELKDRSAGAIAFDEIVSVVRAPYRGHVFDLQTESGWLLANGLAASNCHCHVRSVAKSEYARLVDGGTIAGEPEPIVDDDGNPTGHVRPTRAPVITTRPKVPLVPWTNKRTGAVQLVRAGIDPGFDRPPGVGRRDVKAAQKKRVRSEDRRARR